MKSLIFGIAALTSIQIIHAILFGRCEDNLPKLREEAAKFFTEFQRDHDISRQSLLVIQDASDSLNYALESFDEFDYGIGLHQSLIKCLLKKFFVIFIEERKEVVKSLFQLQDEVEILLDMASTFKSKQFLLCLRVGKLTGCEADLNKLRCELLEFFKGVKTFGHQAEIDLRGIDDTCYDLGKMSRKFSSRNYLSCNEKETETQTDDDDNLQNDIASMFPDFKETHDEGRVKLDDLSGICNNLSATMGTWRAKMA